MYIYVYTPDFPAHVRNVTRETRRVQKDRREAPPLNESTTSARVIRSSYTSTELSY